MNKAYLLIYEDEDEEKGYLLFSCPEAAAEVMISLEANPFDATLIPLGIDASERPTHQYIWTGMDWQYARVS